MSELEINCLTKNIAKLDVASYCNNPKCRTKIDETTSRKYSGCCSNCYDIYSCGYCGKVHMPSK